MKCARALALELRAKHGTLPPSVIAGLCGVEVRRSHWRLADGQLIYFAECTRRPPRIMLNEAAFELHAPEEAAPLSEVVIAHELGHLLLPPPAFWAARAPYEAAAHAFAQELTGLPFHPADYEQALRGQK